MVHIVIGELSLDTEQSSVGGAVGRLGIHHFPVLHGKVNLAAHAAVATGGADNPGFPNPEVVLGLGHEGAHRAGGHAVAAGDAVSVGHGFPTIGNDVDKVVLAYHFQGVDAHQVPAGADTFAAADALIHILQVEAVGKVFLPVDKGCRVGRAVHAVHLAVFLQLAASQLAAVEAVHGVNGQLVPENGNAGIPDGLGFRPHHHAVLRLGAASGDQVVLSLYLAGAHPALGIFLTAILPAFGKTFVVIMAEGGNEDSQLSGSLQNRGALRHFHESVVNLKMDHGM